MEQNGKPAFELILSGLESAPADKPFEPEQMNLLRGLSRAAKEYYARTLNALLKAELGAPGLPTALVRGAQMLYRRIANAFGQASLRLALVPPAEVDQTEIAQFALSSLTARAEELKWHAFERTLMPAVSWQNTNALFLGIESIGMDRRSLAEGATCADAFAHCVLLATLNVGILNPAQVELAYRWLAAAGRGLRVEPFFDPDTHWYQIDLEQPRGPERISPESAVSDTTRFFAVSVLGSALAQARAKLYAGELTIAAPNRMTALHFGAFLDLAERLWSPDWRRATWRDARAASQDESLEVVIGFDAVVRAVGDEDESADAERPSTWTLRDRSSSGIGAHVPEALGAGIQPGTMVAYRASPDYEWEIGSVVRRVRSADEMQWVVGIKRISTSAVALQLQAHTETLQLETEAAPDPKAIYASVSSPSGRVDSLLLHTSDFARNSNYLLPTPKGAFRIKLNRVIERGDTWVRVGFEVLGK